MLHCKYGDIMCSLYLLARDCERKCVNTQPGAALDGIRIWGNIAKKPNASGLVIFLCPDACILWGLPRFHCASSAEVSKAQSCFFPRANTSPNWSPFLGHGLPHLALEEWKTESSCKIWAQMKIRVPKIDPTHQPAEALREWTSDPGSSPAWARSAV